MSESNERQNVKSLAESKESSEDTGKQSAVLDYEEEINNWRKEKEAKAIKHLLQKEKQYLNYASASIKDPENASRLTIYETLVSTNRENFNNRQTLELHRNMHLRLQESYVQQCTMLSDRDKEVKRLQQENIKTEANYLMYQRQSLFLSRHNECLRIDKNKLTASLAHSEREVRGLKKDIQLMMFQHERQLEKAKSRPDEHGKDDRNQEVNGEETLQHHPDPHEQGISPNELSQESFNRKRNRDESNQEEEER